MKTDHYLSILMIGMLLLSLEKLTFWSGIWPLFVIATVPLLSLFLALYHSPAQRSNPNPIQTIAYRATFHLRWHFIIVRPLQDRHLDNGGHGAMHKGSVGGVEKVHAEGDQICFLLPECVHCILAARI